VQKKDFIILQNFLSTKMSKETKSIKHHKHKQHKQHKLPIEKLAKLQNHKKLQQRQRYTYQTTTLYIRKKQECTSAIRLSY
jgi:hypothetical protein